MVGGMKEQATHNVFDGPQEFGGGGLYVPLKVMSEASTVDRHND